LFDCQFFQDEKETAGRRGKENRGKTSSKKRGRKMNRSNQDFGNESWRRGIRGLRQTKTLQRFGKRMLCLDEKECLK